MTAESTSRRGTSSKNAQGSAADCRRRKAWLVETYRADVDLLVTVDYSDGMLGEILEVDATPANIAEAELALMLAGPDLFGFVVVPAARCYRCGDLTRCALELPMPNPGNTVHLASTITPDRIKPGAHGGTYRRENIRPACGPCNTSTGGALGAARRQARRRS